MKKISTILAKGIDNKVLVKWSNDLNDSVEYSVHTLGANHKEDDHDLVWGAYFDDDKGRCEKYFNAMYNKESHLYKLREDIENTASSFLEERDCSFSHDSRFGFLGIGFSSGEEYFFQGEGYENLLDDYQNKSGVSDYVSFEDYIIYVAQSW